MQQREESWMTDRSNGGQAIAGALIGRAVAEVMHRAALQNVWHLELFGRRLLFPDENVTWNLTAIPAANLPLMTSSRWIGCERSLGRVPCARSPLTASNENARPSSGAT